jgi:hypothetical protein
MFRLKSIGVLLALWRRPRETLKDPTGFEISIDRTARSPGRIQFAFIVPMR